MSNYAHPEVLVDTQWVADHLNDPKVRLVEADWDGSAYDSDHVPGAVGWDYAKDMQHSVRLDIPDKTAMEAVLSRSGIGNDTVVVLYGDDKNSLATFAFWLLKIYGQSATHIMNGGRKKWIEEGRPTTTQIPIVTPNTYQAKNPDWSIRARRDVVYEYLGSANHHYIDVRLPEQYHGELFDDKPPQFGERGGHLPGAIHILWDMATHEDGTFKSLIELQAIYGDKGVTADKEVIAYCGIGGWSSHTWFVLTYLLGYPKVRLYDGSWYEWGRLVGAPIEK